jgi:hypothetical protein
LAIRAWNMMNGEINWSALPVIAELLGFTDIERLINTLIAIRDHAQQT